jgi:VanZ family protein
LRIIAVLAAWSIAAAIVASTLLPMAFRPHLATLDPDIERFGAYFVLTLVFMLAYPDKRRLVAMALVLLAIGLELAQLAAPGRHGTGQDAVVKLLGVGLAAAISWLVARSSRRVR